MAMELSWPIFPPRSLLSRRRKRLKKYKQGLGTSDTAESNQYFKDLGKHGKDFIWVDGDAILLAFGKKKIEAGKNWLRQFKLGTFLDQNEKRDRIFTGNSFSHFLFTDYELL
ncbi:hypothetical protein DCAR_0933922 [Daucus carota subsp. sativus]|uniref:DNA topoisomerase (ATP-hydrolyzing) n=2 Tax=Daucus carota subsp. sativus TaxID=79200 RepID=A0A175YDX2_DAUCS|nr:hypothetical protein DCAR_0933922 [Daucus carota subsp. sativus]